MIVLSDNDIRGAASALRYILESSDWADLSNELDVQLVDLEDVGLYADSSDREIWSLCQATDMVLLTADRSRGDGTESLDHVINELSNDQSLPVITIGTPDRVIRDRNYALECAFHLLDYLSRMDGLRGTRRLYLPP